MKKRIVAVRGYLASACRKNVAHLYDLRIEDPAAVRARVKELVDEDRDCFAATKLDDVRLPIYSEKLDLC